MLLDNVSFILLISLEVLILSAAYLVFFVKSPVHAALFLILTFCLSAVWLLFNGAEFLAVLLLVLYVGAIAVLFLFVLMLLSSPQDLKELAEDYTKRGYLKYLRFCLIGAISKIFLFSALNENFWLNDWTNFLEVDTNIQSFTYLFYTYNFVFFFLLALVLLLAMVTVILLTHYKRADFRTQLIIEQVRRQNEILKINL